MNGASKMVALVAMVLALTAVILAALGSHAIPMNGMQSSWQAASNLHLFSAAAMIGLSALIAIYDSTLLRWGTWMIILGAVVFCGSIYTHVITGYSLGAVTPSGGILMMLGWLVAAIAFLRKT